jgi:PST family polysaccharide transporter
LSVQPETARGPVDRLRKWALVNRLGIAKNLRNISWLGADSFATTATAAIVGIAVARSLGPSAAGTWGYAYAIYSVSLLVAALGTDQIIVVDLVSKPGEWRTVLATAVILRLGASVVLSLALILYSIGNWTESPDEAELLCMLALALIVMSLDAVGNLFRAEGRFNRIVVPSIVSTLIGGAAKIFFVIDRRSVIPLGLLTIVQCALLQTMILLSAFRGRIADVMTGFSFHYARDLLRSSVPLMISSIAVFIYMRANIFFLNEYENKADVGIYLAATSICGTAYLLPSVLVSALAPGLYRLFQEDRSRFESRFAFFSNMLTLSLYAVALLVTLLSQEIVGVLYGVKFSRAGPVLALLIWTVIPVAHGLASSVWLAADKRTSFLMIRTIVGGIVNVALNILLIPRFGFLGAVSATLVAMFTVSTFMLILFGKIGRQILSIQLRSLLLIDLAAAVFKPR